MSDASPTKKGNQGRAKHTNAAQAQKTKQLTATNTHNKEREKATPTPEGVAAGGETPKQNGQKYLNKNRQRETPSRQNKRETPTKSPRKASEGSAAWGAAPAIAFDAICVIACA